MKPSMLALAAFAACAASAHGYAGGRDPLDSAAPVPPLEYRSVFSGYRPYQDVSAGRWREVNEQVGRLGGHVGHLAKPQPAAGKPQPEQPEPGAGKPQPAAEKAQPAAEKAQPAPGKVPQPGAEAPGDAHGHGHADGRKP